MVFISALLASLLLYFQERQQELTLEGNNLYTSDASLVRDSPNRVLKNLKYFHDDMRAFGSLEDYGSTRVVAAKDFKKFKFPMHAGNGFSNDRNKEALVGANVEVLSEHGRQYVVVAGIRYEVVGKLGIKADSILQNDILLKNNDLFNTVKSSTTIIDGNGAGNVYRKVSPQTSVESFDLRLDRKTNVDLISPVIFGFGAVMAAIASFCASLMYVKNNKGIADVSYLLGITKWKIRVKNVLVVSTVVLVSCLVSFTVSDIGGINISFDNIACIMFVIYAIIISTTVMFLRMEV